MDRLKAKTGRYYHAKYLGGDNMPWQYRIEPTGQHSYLTLRPILDVQIFTVFLWF